MIFKNLKIYIQKNRLVKIENIDNGIEIVINKKKYKFHNSILMPSLMDSHLHFFGVGESGLMPDLRFCRDEDEMIDLLKGSSLYRGNWLMGFGWNQENFKNKEFPNKKKFDLAFPDTPIFIRRVDGHAALVNSSALKLANINKDTLDPLGGVILKDGADEPTGILIDNALDLIFQKLPVYDDTQIFEIFNFAQSFLIKAGLSQVIDMDLDPYLFDKLKQYDTNGKLSIKIHSFIKAQNDDFIRVINKPYFGKNYSVIGTKYYSDGAIGSRGASLYAPYFDADKEVGLLLFNENDFLQKISKSINLGFQVAVHSIGDAANGFVIDIFDKFISRNFDLIKDFKQKGTFPFRIEHCQMIQDNDLQKLASINDKVQIINSIQPIHFVSDTLNNMAQSRIGEKRMKSAYRWKTLLQSNSLVVAGSDAPIESPNPFLGISSLISSKNQHELLDFDTALTMYTKNAFKSINQDFQENYLQIGTEPNFNVVDENILVASNNFIASYPNNSIFSKSIQDLNVKATIINGNLFI
jgi:hypothetical protein